jgi:hypothetical protein
MNQQTIFPTATLTQNNNHPLNTIATVCVCLCVYIYIYTCMFCVFRLKSIYIYEYQLHNVRISLWLKGSRRPIWSCKFEYQESWDVCFFDINVVPYWRLLCPGMWMDISFKGLLSLLGSKISIIWVREAAREISHACTSTGFRSRLNQ